MFEYSPGPFLIELSHNIQPFHTKMTHRPIPRNSLCLYSLYRKGIPATLPWILLRDISHRVTKEEPYCVIYDLIKFLESHSSMQRSGKQLLGLV